VCHHAALFFQSGDCSRQPMGDAHASHPPSLGFGVASREAATGEYGSRQGGTRGPERVGMGPGHRLGDESIHHDISDLRHLMSDVGCEHRNLIPERVAAKKSVHRSGLCCPKLRLRVHCEDESSGRNQGCDRAT